MNDHHRRVTRSFGTVLSAAAIVLSLNIGHHYMVESFRKIPQYEYAVSKISDQKEFDKYKDEEFDFLRFVRPHNFYTLNNDVVTHNEVYEDIEDIPEGWSISYLHLKRAMARINYESTPIEVRVNEIIKGEENYDMPVLYVKFKNGNILEYKYKEDTVWLWFRKPVVDFDDWLRNLYFNL